MLDIRLLPSLSTSHGNRLENRAISVYPVQNSKLTKINEILTKTRRRNANRRKEFKQPKTFVDRRSRLRKFALEGTISKL